MIYHDSVYEKTQISEPVLVDLMAADAMQRLHGVLQHGISGLIGITSPITRFEHSVGVMILVRRLGGPLTEQIAALLHDVSHTAFSHVIDYVFDNHDGQSYHDDQKATYLAESDIPTILFRYGYDWRDFLDEAKFPILEQPAPRLCCDRLDYFLRDCHDLGLATHDDLGKAVSHLVVSGNRVAANSLDVAQWLAYTFIAADDASWANFREVGLYEVTARAIRRGLEIGAISDADIWGTDEPLWTKLRDQPDERLQSWLRLVSADTGFVWDEENPTFRVSTKIRTIDPDVLIDGTMIPLSKLDPSFAEYRQAYVQRKRGKWPMRVVAHYA
jgi:HD superfamily phosphohydrolase